MNRRSLVAIAGVAVALAAAACSSEDDSSGTGSTTAPAPASTTSTTTEPDGDAATTVPDVEATTTVPDVEATTTVPDGEVWTVESPESNGIEPTVLEQARTYAFAEGRNTQGVVVVHDGVIVAEWYAPGVGVDSWATSWSMAKSVTSALIGIAIDDGLIPSIDEPMSTWFPEWEGTPREEITLRDVLHMESGLAWDEVYSPGAAASSEIIVMGLSQLDHLAYAADQPRADGPARFNYSSGDSMLLSGVIEQATGMSAAEYAEAELFEPLGIDQVEWWQDAAGHTLTYCCIDSTSRDFARFGLLYLRDGRWGDEQVVPADWVEASVTDTAATSDRYGYQWWLRPREGDLPSRYSARGHDGQYIHVIPELDLVVVRNGTYNKTDCEPVADPNLFTCYPPEGLVPGKGTIGPDEWSDEDFLGPIVASLPER